MTRDATVLEDGIRYLERYVLIAGTPRSALDRETLMRALYELGWLNSKWSHPWGKPKAITAFSGFLKMVREAKSMSGSAEIQEMLNVAEDYLSR